VNTLARLLSLAVAAAPVACAETAPRFVTRWSPCSSASQPDRADRKESSPYFDQLKKAVAAKWHPQVVPGFKDPAGPLFRSVDHRATLLVVTLDRTGALKDASVKTSSGIELFDQVALDAMRNAQPFAPPPPSLLDDRNEFRFAFGFCLERGSTRHDQAEIPRR
jgi:TonB family protein